MNLHFHWSASSTSGTKKDENDDSYIVFAAGMNGCDILDSDGTAELDTRDLIFAVSDGMGGGNAGYLASQLILENISQLIPSTFRLAAQGFNPDYLEQLVIQLEKTHDKINETAAQDEAHKGMGATLTLAWFTPENIYLAHVGDSRLYRHRDGKTEQLSEDHSFIWKKLKRGELTEYKYRHHPRKAALYEVIGGGHRNIRPMVAAIPYQAGDQFLICSDGLIDGLWEKHIHKAFNTSHGDMSKLRETLLDRALENDGTDDTTLITLKIETSDSSIATLER